MNVFYEPPLNLYLSILLLGMAIGSFLFCIGRFKKSYHHAGEYSSAAWFIRGIRYLLISLTAGVWSASFFWNQRWLFIIGLVIICQELFEGAILSSALREGAKVEEGKKDFP